MSIIAPQYSLLEIIVDWTSKRILQSITAAAPRSVPLSFTKGDNLVGNLYAVYQSGDPITPIYRLTANPGYIKITDGKAVVYAQATGAFNNVSDPNNPRISFHLNVGSKAIDDALIGGALSLNAFVEVQLSISSPSTDGPGTILPPSSGVSLPQTAAFVKDQCVIFASAATTLMSP
jgi:hypothetical protein